MMSPQAPAHKRLLTNGLANIATGASASILTLILPYFLVRTLHADDFALWMLLFPLANYYNFIGLGFQTSLSRFIAVGTTQRTAEQQGRLLRQAIGQLAIVSLVAFAIFSLVAWRLQDVFGSMSADMLPTGRAVMFVLCLANAIALPFSLFGAAFVGVQRNDRNALMQLLSRAFVAISAIALAFATRALLAMSVAYLVAMILAAIGQALYFRRADPFHAQPAAAATDAMPGHGRAFLRYSLSLSVWAVVSLLLVAAPTSIVGAVDYAAVAGFSLANTFLTFLIGIFNALITPMTQSVAARYGSTHDTPAFHAELRRFSFVCSGLLMLGAAWLIVLAPPFLQAWVGARRASEALPFVLWLTLANVLRNLQSPFSVFVIAVGKQARIFWLPAIEAALATGCSLYFGRLYGASAVGISLAVAAAVGATLTALFALPATLGGGQVLGAYLKEAIAWPFALACPALIVTAWAVANRAAIALPLVLLVLATAFAGFAGWRHLARRPSTVAVAA